MSFQRTVPAETKACPLGTQRISEALETAGYGAAIFPRIERVQAVPKFAFAVPGKRPSPLQAHEEHESHDDAGSA
jgi:hypothetical protein